MTTIAAMAAALLMGEEVVVKPWPRSTGEDWSSTLQLADGKYWLRERNCFSDNCNCVSHEPWHESEVSPRVAYQMLADRARELWLQAEPGEDPVAMAALESKAQDG